MKSLQTLSFFFLLWCECRSFTSSSITTTRQNPTRKLSQRISHSPFQLHVFDFLKNDSSATTRDESSALDDLRKEVEEMLITSKGQLAVETLEPLFTQIEAQSTYDEPNRASIYKETWHVWYTDCPPPSDGKLGPFQGSAEQDITPSGSNAYNNILRLPPNSGDNEWLTVVLRGIWEDWDGIELDSSNNDDASVSTLKKNEDWGSKFWKVTFLSLEFSLFGNLLKSIDFPPNTARVWRTTFLDETTKIVRASKTGRKDDESVFYMKRTERPSP